LKINHKEEEIIPLSLFKTEIVQKNKYGKNFFFIAKNILDVRNNISKNEKPSSDTSLKEKIERKKMKNIKIINKLEVQLSVLFFLKIDLPAKKVIKNVKKIVKNISIVKE
jgi:hypothetical protein